MPNDAPAPDPERAPAKRSAASGGQTVGFDLGAGTRRFGVSHPARKRGEPVYRALRIYTVDPATPRLEGCIATVQIPYEKLDPGPLGARFEVDNTDGALKLHYRRAQLDDANVLIPDGYEPSQSDPRFHQQMVYAVASRVYETFRCALGRDVAWGFDGKDGRPPKLVLRPHWFEQANAYYTRSPDQTSGEVCFGYYSAGSAPTDRTLPGGFVFTCLSHDVIAHEVTHALLDGMRANFMTPTSNDVLAFHEAFADLVALFQHFSYPDVVVASIRRSRGELDKAAFLTELARQVGHTTGRKAALRSAISSRDMRGLPTPSYNEDMEAHQLGSVLVAAVFEAFLTVYKRKTERYVRLATGGSGVIPAGELAHDLQVLLAERASRLASQFLSMCIRAVDYCPPVGVTFGDYLRALITADYDLVLDDPWAYREALIDSFRTRNIYPRSVASLDEDALLWRTPRKEFDPIPDLNHSRLHFVGNPDRQEAIKEMQRQANALGEVVSQRDNLEEFGLVTAGDERLEGDEVTRPCIESIRTSRRAGPDRQVGFDLIAEVTQLRRVRARRGDPGFAYHGGSTIILNPQGEIRYAILKSVVGKDRLERRRDFIYGPVRRYWDEQGKNLVPKAMLFKSLHASG